MKYTSQRTSGDHPARHAFTIVGMVAITLLLVAFIGATALYARTFLASNQMAAVISAVMVDLTNEDREKEQLGTLKVNPVLVAAAQAKADDMAEKGYFAHNSPGGENSWFWFKEAGYSFAYAGENLAVDFTDSEDVVDAWMDSPTHRANILDSRFTEVGIATAVGTYKGQKAIFVVQMFGTPARTAAPAAVIAVNEPLEPEAIAVARTDVLGSASETSPVVEEESIAASIAVPDAEPVVAAAEPAPTSYAPAWGFFAASPTNLLRVLYALCALLLLTALFIVTKLEWKRHHAPHAFAMSFLLMVMIGLFYVADRFVFVAPTITTVPSELKA